MKGAEVSTPPLPTSLRELGAWQVFADQLTEKGNRLGPYLAYELALGSKPTKEQLAVFHKMAQRICKVPKQFSATWMLGQVRVLTVTRDATRTLSLIDGDALLTLRDLLPTPPLRHLERLVLGASRYSMRRRWEAAMKYLPPSCRTMELHTWFHESADSPALLAAIPKQIEVLRFATLNEMDPAELLNDRFEWLDLRSILLTPDWAGSLAGALRTTSRVKLRVGCVTELRHLLRLGDRVVLGDTEDAALVEEEGLRRAVCLLERMRPEQLQLRYGVVSAHAQVERALPEPFRLGKNSRGFGDTASWTSDAVLTRTLDGWKIQVTGGPDATPVFALNGQRLGEEAVALKEGDRLSFDGRSFRFVSRCGGPLDGYQPRGGW